MYTPAALLLSSALSVFAAAAPAIPATRLPGSFHPCIDGFAVMNEWFSPRIGIRCGVAVPQAALAQSNDYTLVQQAALQYPTFEDCANACSEAAEANEGSCCAAEFVSKDQKSCLFVESRTGKCGAQSTFVGPERVGHQVALVLKR